MYAGDQLTVLQSRTDVGRWVAVSTVCDVKFTVMINVACKLKPHTFLYTCLLIVFTSTQFSTVLIVREQHLSRHEHTTTKYTVIVIFEEPIHLLLR